MYQGKFGRTSRMRMKPVVLRSHPPSGSLNLFSSKPGDGCGSSRFRLMSCSCSGAWSRRRQADSPSLAGLRTDLFRPSAMQRSCHVDFKGFRHLTMLDQTVQSREVRSPEHPCHGQGPGGKFESRLSFEQCSTEPHGIAQGYFCRLSEYRNQ